MIDAFGRLPTIECLSTEEIDRQHLSKLELPEPVQTRFERHLCPPSPPIYVLRALGITAMQFEDGQQSYGLISQVTFRQRPHSNFRSITVVDCDKAGERIGEGSARFYSNTPYADRLHPYVFYTETIEDERGQGHGSRRLRILNALCEEVFCSPLFSSTLMNDASRATWGKVEAAGLAVQYRYEDMPRWHFLPRLHQ